MKLLLWLCAVDCVCFIALRSAGVRNLLYGAIFIRSFLLLSGFHPVDFSVCFSSVKFVRNMRYILRDILFQLFSVFSECFFMLLFLCFVSDRIDNTNFYDYIVSCALQSFSLIRISSAGFLKMFLLFFSFLFIFLSYMSSLSLYNELFVQHKQSFNIYLTETGKSLSN